MAEKVTFWTKAGKVLNNPLVDFALNFGGRKLGGDSNFAALTLGALETVAWRMLGVPGLDAALGFGMIGVTAGSAAYKVGRARWYRLLDKYYNSAMLGGDYQDTQQAYTMRQAAVQAIQNSKINGRSALGNEASFLHR